MKPLNKYFDSTLLKPEATDDQIKALCDEAKKYDFYSVCVNSCHVNLAARELADSDVKISAVIGFPLGACLPAVKAFEAEEVCRAGAAEIDMVMNIGKLKSGQYEYVQKDIAAVAEAANEYGSIVKVILETCLLSDEEIEKACSLAREAGAYYVKTSTGFCSGGASVRHIKLMKAAAGDSIQIKASGGIKCYDDAMAMIDAGADRIGTSAAAAIMEEANTK